MGVKRVRLVHWFIGAIVVGLVAAGNVPAAQASPDLVSVPIGQVPARVGVVAASGDDLLAYFAGKYEYSSDGGAHWSESVVPCEDADRCDFGRVAGGVLPLWHQDLQYPAPNSPAHAYWYSMKSNTIIAGPLPRPSAIQYGLDFSGASAGGYVAFTEQWIDPHQAPSPSHYLVMSQTGATREFTGSAGFAVAADGSVVAMGPKYTTLTRISPSGETTQLVAASTGTIADWSVVGSNVVYSIFKDGGDVGDKSCVVSLETLKQSCSSFVGTIYSTTDSAVIAYGPENSSVMLRIAPIVNGALGTVSDVRLPSYFVPSDDLPSSQEGGDPVFPIRNDSSSTLVRVGMDGTPTTVATFGTQQADPRTLALSPTTLLGVDDSTVLGWPGRVWRRSAESGLGDQKSFGTASQISGQYVAASGARWAVGRSDGTIQMYDRDGAVSRKLTGLHSGTIVALSGAQLLATSDVYRDTGDFTQSRVWSPRAGWQVDAQAEDVFGSLVLDVDQEFMEGPAKVTIRDLAGSVAPVKLKYTDVGSEALGFRLWGDWVAATRETETSKTFVEVRNWRTEGKAKTHPGTLVALGDGVAVLDPLDDSGDLVAWNFGTGAETKLVGAASHAGGLSMNGARVAYDTASDIVVQTIPGVGRSAPRTLDVVAPAAFAASAGKSWSADVDLTKPVGAGNLEVVDSAGKVVRTIPVPASASGSLRGIVWDGKDASGKVQPPGEYRLRLTSKATDGSGAVVSIDARSRYLGSVKIARAFASAPVPTVTGTPTNRRTLTAHAGAWSPKPTSLSYRWLRDGKAITGATKAKYRLTTADVGKTVTVRVTAAKSGYVTTATVSAGRTVAAARFTRVGAVSISGKAKVGSTLTGRIGAISPKPSAIRYQWFRNGTAITGATKAKYVPVAADKGATLTVQVSVIRAGYKTVVKLSAGRLIH